MMNSVSVQIQRAINEAISNQILPQIQNAVMAGSGQLTKERWNVPAERPEGYSEVLQNLEPKNNSKSKQGNDRLKDGFTSTNSRAYDTCKSKHHENGGLKVLASRYLMVPSRTAEPPKDLMIDDLNI